MTDRAQTSEPGRIQSLQAAVAPALALHAGVKLGLFTAIGDETLTASEIASRLGVAQERLERLLYALVVAGLLEMEDGGFRNGAEAAVFLVRGRPRYIGDEHQLLDELWRADFLTADSIRAGGPAARHDFALADHGASIAFFRGLVPGTLQFGRQLASIIDMESIASAIDIGGGPGSALIGLREAKPALAVTLLELPAGIALARELLAEEPLADGIVFESGDIVDAPSTKTHDIAILKAVIQVLSRQQAARALRHAHASLNAGGTVYISGAGILSDDRLSPVQAVFYNLTFMNLYPDGASYTRSEYAAWLADAGFRDVRFTALPSGAPLISAVKP